VLSPADVPGLLVRLRSNLLVKLGETTGRSHAVPMVLFAPTARCNSRCVSCDWWQSDGKSDLCLEEIRALAAELPRLGTRVVVFTGGEPLVRPDVMEVADLFRAQGLTLQLLTSGLALERHAAAVAARFQTVIVSLDGHTPELYRNIRGVDGLAAVSAGVQRLRAIAPQVTVKARSTLHRLNFRHLPDLVAKAHELGLDQISFLAADVTSDAFNRRPSLPQAEPGGGRQLLLDPGEVEEFAEVVEATIAAYRPAIEAGRVAPAAQGLRRLPAYYRAHLGQAPFPPVDCNAPWMSVLIEADGAVRPCFFHAAVGNLRERPLRALLGHEMPAFRRGLDVASDPLCGRCVCTIKVGLRSKMW
jgi:MoaA/NifB/PqqE/SkfB family radical SAM enzyme